MTIDPLNQIAIYLFDRIHEIISMDPEQQLFEFELAPNTVVNDTDAVDDLLAEMLMENNWHVAIGHQMPQIFSITISRNPEDIE